MLEFFLQPELILGLEFQMLEKMGVDLHLLLDAIIDALFAPGIFVGNAVALADESF